MQEGRGLTGRRGFALLVGGVAGGAVALVVSRMPLDTHEEWDVGLLIWLLAGGQLLLSHRWRPRRRARLVWRARVAGRYGVEAGLVARRSLVEWAQLGSSVAVPTVLAFGLLARLPDHEWSELVRSLVALGIGVFVGKVAYGVARFTGALALTASGVRQGRQHVPWPSIRETVLRRSSGRVDGVYLRTMPSQAGTAGNPNGGHPGRTPTAEAPSGGAHGRAVPVTRTVGGRAVAVPDERLLAAIEHYRTRPDALAVGLPVDAPEPAGGSPVKKGPLLYRRR
ncbi:hypothetical protein [Micromonospora sp. NPDC126480]|uniref:hypothetical protein n=1 Tax=Micromonospora sp. NPDC126480 TaxID=3155312 RepID=UPI0033291D40